MYRRIPAQALRGSDKLMLETQIQDMLRRPMSQLAPANVCDLVALAEYDGRPKTMRQQLDAFVERTAKEVTDIPSGPAFEAFLDEIAEIEPSRVPHTFRVWMATQADERQSQRLGDMVQAWETVDAEPFSYGDRGVKVERRTAAAASPATSLSRKTTGGTRKKAAAAPRRAAAKPVDPDRVKTIRMIVVETLDGSSDKGLAETVLVAGVRYRAKQQDCDGVIAAEVTAILRELKKQDRVHYSAGRWRSLRSRW